MLELVWQWCEERAALVAEGSPMSDGQEVEYCVRPVQTGGFEVSGVKIFARSRFVAELGDALLFCDRTERRRLLDREQVAEAEGDDPF